MKTYTTPRLSLHILTQAYHEFIAELVNSPEWLNYISDGKTKTHAQVTEYIQKITDNPMCTYWVVQLHAAEQVPIGVITFMKREYLEHYDIGFAFLPQFANKGYAFEATTAVINDVKSTTAHLLAVTVPNNTKSIRLLEKLGFKHDRLLLRDNETLLLYSLPIVLN
ncbi:MAG: GNAT family N-acetyltransferase [Bacteroidetes bacterium]|nr:GNAT family N-acetyltransferase [Bacteroidota bacterium]